MKRVFGITILLICCACTICLLAGCAALFCDHHFVYSETIREADCHNVSIEMHICDKCSAEKEVYGDGIRHTNLVKTEGYAATCTNNGLTDGKMCLDCNSVIVEQEVIPASHKTVVTRQAKEPTCTEAGCTEETTCTVCSSIVSKSITLEALGHKESYNITKEPTCINSGIASGSICTVCSETVLSGNITIPAKGHVDQTLDDICDICSALLGTDVIQISTLTELKSVAFNLSGKYKLVADITLDSNWMPLGTQENPFTGYFDGNGHTISGLTLNSETEGGVFLYNSGTVTNLTVKSMTLSVSNCNLMFGGVAAYNNGTVKYCTLDGQNSLTVSVNYSVNGSINNQYRAEYTTVCGGIVGINKGTVQSCSTQGSFVCNYSNSVTFKLNTSIFYIPNSSDNCKGTAFIYFGGIVGKNSSTVENCTAIQNNSNTIKVNATLSSRYGCVYADTKAYIGSLVGSNTATVKNCKTKPSIIDTNVGQSSGDGQSYLCQASLSLDTKSTYYLTIGENTGTVSGLVLL